MTDDIFQAAGQPAADERGTGPDRTAGGAYRRAGKPGRGDQAGRPYARAETQNVRRRLEKDIADARAYASTSFARDILSVADNLSRALDRSRPNCVRMRS
jgi:molecular chaperone GrpE